MWDAVRHLTTVRKQDCKRMGIVLLDGANADSFNEHYANISTDWDSDYSAPSYKLTASSSAEYITKWQVFNALDRRRPTSIPAWIYCRHGF